MFAEFILITGNIVAAIIVAVLVVYTLMPGTRFFKKHGRSYLESDEPHE